MSEEPQRTQVEASHSQDGAMEAELHDWRHEVDAKIPYPKTATSRPAPGSRTARPTRDRGLQTSKSIVPGYGRRVHAVKLQRWGHRQQLRLT